MHLGHVAKCFGLRDSPKTIRVHDDTISKIFNGQYSAALFNDKEAKKKARDEKFSLSKSVKKDKISTKPVQSGGNKWRGGASDTNIPKEKDFNQKTENTKNLSTPVARAEEYSTYDSKKSKNDDFIITNTSKPIPIIIPSDKRKLRIGTKSNINGTKVLAPSGKFRKSTDGYFRKKLRDQSSSEFSA